MKVANVEIKVETFTSRGNTTNGFHTKTVVNTRFEEVRGYSNFSLQGSMLIFYNVGKNGDHVAYNQDNVVGFTTSVE